MPPKHLSRSVFFPTLIPGWILVLIASAQVEGSDLGLVVPEVPPVLALNFGNPTDYRPLKPEPASLPLGPAGERFRGTASMALEETHPERPPGISAYGGPGDSWSGVTLISPTQGNAPGRPIQYIFDSRIHNRSTAVGYFTGADTPQALRWEFPQPAERIYFRVEWNVAFTGFPFEEQECSFDLSQFQVICTDVQRHSSGTFQGTVGIEGYGSIRIPAAGVSPKLGPGIQAYSGSLSGVAERPHLALTLNHAFYVGQDTRGDSAIHVEMRFFADTVPLPEVPLVLRPLPGPDNRWSLSWPLDFIDHQLQQSSNLSTSEWAPVNAEPTNDGTQWSVSIPAPVEEVFYRLFRP